VALNQQENTRFSMESGMRMMSWVQIFFFCTREWYQQLRVTKVELVNNRMSYVILRGRWCHIVILNVHVPTEDKIDDVKDSLYEELEKVSDKVLNTI
jgi:hypothetical protein